MSQARDYAEKIHKAIVGWGTDDDALIEIITSHNHKQLDEIWDEYQVLYNKSVAKEVEGDVSGHYGTLITRLLLRKGDYLALEIKEATQGLGTDEDELIDALAHAENKDLQLANEMYRERTKTEASAAIKGDTSGPFRKTLIGILQADRRDGQHAGTDAETLYQQGEGAKTFNEDFFAEFFSRHSTKYLLEVDEAYLSRYGHTIVGTLAKKVSGDLEKLLVAMITPRSVYWARRISFAIKGAGTKDDLLIRAFTINDHEQLARIIQAYEKEYARNFLDDISSEASGNYKKTLVSLIKYSHVKH